jgi:hypothetical protein
MAIQKVKLMKFTIGIWVPGYHMVPHVQSQQILLSAKDRRPSWNRWLASLTWAWQWALWTAVPLGSDRSFVERKWRSRRKLQENGFWGSNFCGFHQNAEVNLYRISDLLSTQSLSCVGEVFCRNVGSLQSRTLQLASLVYSYVGFGGYI